MFDLSVIPEATLLARGSYATVRAEHEDCKKALSVLCGKLNSISSQILRKMQPDNDAIPESIDDMMRDARKTIDEIEAKVNQIESLAKQRAELKKDAWS
jgi:hypothetical protein